MITWILGWRKQTQKSSVTKRIRRGRDNFEGKEIDQLNLDEMRALRRNG